MFQVCVSVLSNFPVTGTKYLVPTNERKRGLFKLTFQTFQSMANLFQGRNKMADEHSKVKVFK